MDDAQVKKLVGIRIRALRASRRYKRESICAIIGVSREQVSYYEAGKSEVPAASLYKLAYHFGVPMDYFYYGISKYTPVDMEEILSVQREKRVDVVKAMDRKSYKSDEKFRIVKSLVESMSRLDEPKEETS